MCLIFSSFTFPVTLWLSDLDNYGPGEDLRWCRHTVTCVSAAGNGLNWTALEVNSQWRSGPRRYLFPQEMSAQTDLLWEEMLWWVCGQMSHFEADSRAPPRLQGLRNRQKHAFSRPASRGKEEEWFIFSFFFLRNFSSFQCRRPVFESSFNGGAQIEALKHFFLSSRQTQRCVSPAGLMTICGGL